MSLPTAGCDHEGDKDVARKRTVSEPRPCGLSNRAQEEELQKKEKRKDLQTVFGESAWIVRGPTGGTKKVRGQSQLKRGETNHSKSDG